MRQKIRKTKVMTSDRHTFPANTLETKDIPSTRRGNVDEAAPSLSKRLKKEKESGIYFTLKYCSRVNNMWSDLNPNMLVRSRYVRKYEICKIVLRVCSYKRTHSVFVKLKFSTGEEVGAKVVLVRCAAYKRSQTVQV